MPGAGPHRIGTNLEIREDMYSKLFLSSLHAEYIFDMKKAEEDDAELMDEIIEEHIEHPKKSMIGLALKQEELKLPDLNTNIQDIEEPEEEKEEKPEWELIEVPEDQVKQMEESEDEQVIQEEIPRSELDQ